MTKYVYAYLGWLAGVLAMTAAAVAWYAHVEKIGARELASRLRGTEDTEVTETPDAE
jgi:hypothetical protein